MEAKMLICLLSFLQRHQVRVTIVTNAKGKRDNGASRVCPQAGGTSLYLASKCLWRLGWSSSQKLSTLEAVSAYVCLFLPLFPSFCPPSLLSSLPPFPQAYIVGGNQAVLSKTTHSSYLWPRGAGWGGEALGPLFSAVYCSRLRGLGCLLEAMSLQVPNTLHTQHPMFSVSFGSMRRKYHGYKAKSLPGDLKGSEAAAAA